MWGEKIKIERAMGPRILMASAGWETQQPTKKRPVHWGIFGGEGAQRVDDRGGRGRIFSTIGFRGKKLNTHQNLLLLEAAANRKLHTTTGQINADAMGEG